MSIPIHEDTAVCPMCLRDTAVDALCECDDPIYGALCAWNCCPKWHKDEREAA